MNAPQRAQLALLLEVAATPTPGAIDRRWDHTDLRFEHFLAGAVGAAPGLSDAAAGEPLGPAFKRAVMGMAAAQTGGNTQFGALLLLCPLVRAAVEDRLTPAGTVHLVAETTVDDAVAFCLAFDHVDVAVGEPPAALAELDVRDPIGAATGVEDRGLTLAEFMAQAANVDDVAREWTTGFERSFEAAGALLDRDGPVGDRAAEVFLDLLCDCPDTFVAKRHGPATAEQVVKQARAVRQDEGDLDGLAESWIIEGINPGTTADLLAAGLFVALERGLAV